MTAWVLDMAKPPSGPRVPWARVGLALLLLAAVLWLVGCSKTQREGSAVRRWSEQGEQGGVPFSKAGEETTETRETSTTGIDTVALGAIVTTAVKAAMAAGTGGLGLGLPEAAGAAMTLIAGGAAYVQSRKAARKSAEADAAWDEASEAKIQAALMTPPPKGKA